MKKRRLAAYMLGQPTVGEPLVFIFAGDLHVETSLVRRLFRVGLLHVAETRNRVYCIERSGSPGVVAPVRVLVLRGSPLPVNLPRVA